MSDNPAVQVTAKPVTTPAVQATAPAVTTPVTSTPVENTEGEPYDAERAMALIKKLREENRDLRPLAKKAADLEVEAKKKADAELSEVERLKKHNQELEAKVHEAELREMRRSVGTEYKLPQAIADLLPGGDLETMKAKAAELAKAIPQQSLSPTNPNNAQGKPSDAERRAFMFGNGGLPDRI